MASDDLGEQTGGTDLVGRTDQLVPPPGHYPLDHPGVQDLAGLIRKIIQTPLRALQSSETMRTGGEYDPGPVLGMSGMAMGGAMPFAQRGSAGIFGGRLAQTADRAALARAEEMASKGVGKDEIWNSTGWFQGADGKWRFEIPDNKARLTGRGSSIKDSIDHSELFQAYPDIQNVKMLYGERPGGAAHYPSHNGSVERIGVSGLVPPQDASLHLHELQHAVQAREGFAPGASPSAMLSVTERVYGPRSSMTDETYNKAVAASREAYRSHAGEVEARNVQTRMHMTPEERRKSAPWTTQDVPDIQQIVRKLVQSR